MSDELVEQEKRNEPEPGDEAPVRPRRRFFSRRTAFVVLGLAAVGIIAGAILSVVLYRTGVGDRYIKDQFTAKMADIGITFDADVFRVTVMPLELELKNATFNDRISGEKLFFVRDAHLGLTVKDLWAWQLSRDITIDTTEINGAEAWVKFDENGRSNFSNLRFVEDQAGSRVNFRYESIKFALRDSVVHFNDFSRKVSADANNFFFLLEPEDLTVPDEQKRYKFDIGSNDSKFEYDERPLTPIDIRARGIADRTGADITSLNMTTPLGTSALSGKLTDWAALKYDLNVESTVDLTQATTIFPLGTPIRGVGNFKGHVTGQGETYRVEGAVDSQSLTAEGIYLKGLNVAATVEGTNSSYAANGNAIAELLTFEDFRIEFPKLAGNVRGTGTDFRWVGELQAVAASSRSMTIGGLYLSDAVAEMKDRQLTASAANGRAQKFSIDDNEFAALTARNLRFSLPNGNPDLKADSAAAASFTTKDYKLNDVKGQGVRIKKANGKTDVDVSRLQARNAEVKGKRLDNVTARDFKFTDLPNSVELTAKDLKADRLNADGTTINGLQAPQVSLTDTPSETRIYSDQLRVASIDAGGAVLGSLNIGGVRLTIRQGHVEGRSDDIDAGSIKLKQSSSLPEGGRVDAVKLAKPVFVLEPSGRYRASADMSIGGGTIGSVPLGAAQAKLTVNNDGADLNDLMARVMDGTVTGNATIAFSNKTRSVINADFSDLDLGKIAALQSSRVIPLEGRANGRVALTLRGTDYRTTSGTINASVAASAGNTGSNKIPVTGTIDLAATDGLFTVDRADLRTDKTRLNATGRFDLRNDDSNLDVSLTSSDANELTDLVRITGLAPAVESKLDSMKIALAGNATFNGKITGNLADPTIDGKASLASLSMRGRELGAITSDVLVSPAETEFRNGKLVQGDGGSVAFNVKIPSSGTNNITVNAELAGVNAGNLLAALPVDLPERLNDFNGKTSGTVALSGLPDQSKGEINIASESGTIGGQSFDSLTAKAVFSGTRVNIERGEIRVGEGLLGATGSYDTTSTRFDLDLRGNAIPLPLALAFLPADASLPPITGAANFTARAVGEFDRPAGINVTFDGTAADVAINDRPLGTVTFKGTTTDQVLNADLVATLDNRPQTINATLNFGDDALPFHVRTSFDQSPLGPFFAFVPQLTGISVDGVGTGQVEFGGNIAHRDAAGKLIYSAEALTGSARFSQLSLRLQDMPISATEPVVVRFDTREVVFENAKFAGSGSSFKIAGTVAMRESGNNNFSVDGRLNLSILNVIPQVAGTDNFFGGFADVSIRLAGPKRVARLSGTAVLDNASFATFIGSDRLTFDRLKGRILFASNQVQIEQAKGYLGGGEFVANGGAVLGDDLQLAQFRFDLTGNNITVPLPEDFITTGDAKLEVSGRRTNSGALSTLIAGEIRARRSVYTQDIDLSKVFGARREGSLSSGPSSIRAPRFDLVIEGRDALVVRNNVADLTASASLRLTGTTEDPQISGRITANSGTVFFRKDRYIVQRGVLEFPPNTSIEPVINLQAESEIAGYQVFVNLSGPLTDTENLSANVRSSPALPQADVISLITTGNLSNTEAGIPTLAQTGINTAAEVLTDTIINNPARKATDKLFGLNVFEIDPIFSGQRLNASARLTVGRQINNNLRVTYATNLSQDQNQVLALEYRVSNKLSFVAQYEQRSLTNVTQDRNSFSFEVRFRRRF